MVSKRGKSYYLRIRPFGGKEIGVKTNARGKNEAKQIEMAVMTAIRAGDYRALTPNAREVCIRIFRNQQMAIPSDLCEGDAVSHELTLWSAIKMCLTYPGIRNSPNRIRHEQAFFHVVDYFGENFPVNSIWIPQIREYQTARLSLGVAPSTVNKEKAALSRMFQVLVELRRVEVNPVRSVKNLCEKSGERQVYFGYYDFLTLIQLLPPWLKPLALTGFYTGMRQGEIVGLERRNLKLSQRLVVLGPEDVKEGQWKRVPIHAELVPVLRDALQVQSIMSNRVFLIDGRPITRHSIRKPWIKAMGNMGISPAPTFHDLRHTWKTNARRSGMDQELRENIMGHYYKSKSVVERYGRINDHELISAIDSMTFDHGETEILLSSSGKKITSVGSNSKSGTLRTKRVQSII